MTNVSAGLGTPEGGRVPGSRGSLGPVIGNVALDSSLVLAPLSGITDDIFRLLCKEKGASLVFSEMISSDGLVRGNALTLSMLSFADSERPIAVQLFGSDPDIMARAAEKALKFSPDLIDLNFGCPARKIVGKQAGSALLNNLALLRKIASQVVSAVRVPITAKIRSGWDEKSINADKVCVMLEDCGVKAVTVHARSRSDKFAGKADWEVIARAKQAVRIPVIGNGDVLVPEDAARMLDETGCDAVMIGRAALGNPWIFSRSRHFLATGEMLPPPSEKERIELLLRHMALAEKKAPSLAMRKHIGWYTKGMPQSSKLRQEANRASSFEEMRNLVKSFAAAQDHGDVINGSR